MVVQLVVRLVKHMVVRLGQYNCPLLKVKVKMKVNAMATVPTSLKEIIVICSE